MRSRSMLVPLVAAMMAAGAPARAQEPSDTRARPPEIVTSGEGTRTVQADRASVMVSVETRAPTPSAAGVANARLNTAIRDAIAALGVPREDITTSGYNVYPMRREPYGGPPEMRFRDTGFVANNAVRVTLRRPEQLGLVGRVIDTALTAGATFITGVRYEARRTDEAEREALADAVADARARAEALARAAGGSLGELLELSTQALRGMTERDFAIATSARMRGGPPTEITPREIEVRQFVMARWRFVPGRR
ncbi:MAG: SIMPL domain-containing protein [Gemmatimonadaceae bacterium]